MFLFNVQLHVTRNIVLLRWTTRCIKVTKIGSRRSSITGQEDEAQSNRTTVSYWCIKRCVVKKKLCYQKLNCSLMQSTTNSCIVRILLSFKVWKTLNTKNAANTERWDRSLPSRVQYTYTLFLNIHKFF